MEKRYVLAYDLGTSGVKGAVVTLDGKVTAAASSGYPYRIPQPGWAEQKPEDYWQGVCRVTEQVLEIAGVEPGEIAGIAFGTLWKGIIPVDRQGNVLRSSILWLDGRAVEQAQKLNAHFQTTRFNPTDYWSKLYWLREHEPDVVENAQWILEVNSYLKWKATGKAAVDISNCFTRSFDPALDAFDRDVLAYIGIPREKFPPLVRATDRVGELTERAAAELHLIPGIPVFGGNTDIQGVAVGAGSSAIGGVHAYFGSSGWIGFTIAHTERSFGASFDEKRDVLLSGMKGVGLALNWVATRLYREEFDRLGEGVYQLIDRDVSQIPAGSDGVLATGWFYGENPPQSDADAGAVFLNLKALHDRRHMARAVMEGICFYLKQRTRDTCSYRRLEWPRQICAVGGGACSDVWMQILADVLNVTIRVPESPRHAGAVGTACGALIGLGVWEDYQVVGDRLQIYRCHTPNPKNTEIYEKVFSAYTRIYGALKPIYEILNEKRKTE